MATASTPAVAVALTPRERADALIADVRDGLAAAPRSLPSKWLYDEAGCALFDAITELPEYYPTRAERSILETRAHEIAGLAGAETLIEIGSGTSTKTRLLIEALLRSGTLRRFVAFDVAEATLRSALETLARDYPAVEMSGVVGDFERHLDRLPDLPGRLVVFLGGTIGNLDAPSRSIFYSDLAAVLRPGEGLLLGVDLVKDTGRLVAAYDDASRITEAFEKNVLAVVNRELDADFDLDRFAYRAAWSATEERIEMTLVSRGSQQVDVAALDMVVDLADGEEILTEISTKFRLDALGLELAANGLEPVASWTDPAGDFAVVLTQRSATR